MFYKKVYNKIIIFAAITAVILLAGISVYGAEFSLYTFADCENENTKINIQQIGEENVLVLPSSVSHENICLFSDSDDMYAEGKLKKESFSSGNAINLGDYCEEGDYILKFIHKDGEENVRFLFSENVPAVFLISDDPLEKGRKWVEESPDKSHKATGKMVIKKANGEIVYDGGLTQIKGRGNSTWAEVKKPYQIKTAEKADLLQTGNEENKSKTWVLLANYLDSSLVNNSLVLGIGKELGMRTNIENAYVDLYYDGEYRGNYLLSEKVEVGSGRVKIADMEKANEDVNPGIDAEELPINTGTTQNGATFTYCEGLTSPEDISGGYLLEMDYEVRAKEEACYFKTSRGQYVVVKSPEYASREEMEYIASLYQEYEDAVYNDGINSTTGKLYSDYIDKESLACYYLINEFTKARDFFGSSAYLQKDMGEEKFIMGPLWDYDMSMGKSREKGDEPALGMSIYNTPFGENLLKIKDFRLLLSDIYKNKFFPIIKEILSEENDEKSLLYTEKHIDASSDVNSLIWHSGKKTQEEYGNLRNFIWQRAEFLRKTFLLFEQSEEYETGIFADVLPWDWFGENVQTVNRAGYMSGVSERFFDPYSKVSRAEAAQVLYNMETTETVFFGKFSDVEESDWFSGSVIWATEEGLLEGFSDGTFRPENKITREELIVALYRYEKSPVPAADLSDRFKDWEKISPGAEKAFLWATEKKILIGDEGGNLNPHSYLSRAEMAAILVRK